MLKEELLNLRTLYGERLIFFFFKLSESAFLVHSYPGPAEGGVDTHFLNFYLGPERSDPS